VRVVLDTNVLLSAVFTRGVCEAVLDACIAMDGCSIVISEHILAEFTEHAVEKFGAPKGVVRETVGFLRRNCMLVDPAPLPRDACGDPDDIPVLGTALSGDAHALVTGDAELLRMDRFESVPILSPRAFFERLV